MTRFLATTLAFALFVPHAQAAPIAARVLRTPASSVIAPAPVISPALGPLSLALPGAPTLSNTTLPNLAPILPALGAAPSAAPVSHPSSPIPVLKAAPPDKAAATRAAARKRVTALTHAIAADSEAIAAAPVGSARGGAHASFRRLLGGPGFIAEDSSPVPVSPAPGKSLLGPSAKGANAADAEPPAPKPASASSLKTYLAGTALFKLGMEAVGLGVPLIALTIFGQAKWAAVMAVGYGLSQIVFSSLAGGLLDRKSPTKVLAWSMALQAASVSAMIALFAADLYLPGMLGFPLAQPVAILALHALNGGFTGVSDTARQVIPPELIGPNRKEIKLFNAKTHVAYEIAGVIGALGVGLIMTLTSPVTALLIHPPAYLLAAWVFSRINLPKRTVKPPISETAASTHAAGESQKVSPLAEHAALGFPLKRIWTDLKRGAKAVLSVREFRWAAVALIGPLMIHRLLEGLLIPVAANSLLGNPAAAAWIIGASNFGELLGALLLIRAVKKSGDTDRFRSPFWIRWMALGLLGLWAFTFSPTLWVLLPLIAFGSLTWAASDLSLRTRLQNGLPRNLRGRSFAFVGAVAFALVLAASLGLGTLFDAVAAAPVFVGINVAVTLIAAALLYAAKRVKTNGDAAR